MLPLLLATALAPAPAALLSLVDSERSFAAKAAKEGTPAAFLSVLHPESVMFNPGPVSGRSIYENRTNDGSLLSWYPAVAEVAASGDFGWTTGPWEYRKGTTAAPVTCGWYVSLWTREKGGPWQLRVDVGTGHALPAEKPVDWSPAMAKAPGLGGPKEDPEAAFEAQASFPAAYAAAAAADLRVYREQTAPREGEAARKAALAAPGTPRWKKAQTYLAASGDLAAAYGEVTRDAPASRAIFVHFWRRTRDGWKLVLDLEKPLPETRK